MRRSVSAAYLLSFAAAFLAPQHLAGQAALNFNSGAYSAARQPWTIELRPTGGTPPYSFSYAPGAAVIPSFRVANRPDSPTYLSSLATGLLIGNPTVPGTYSTVVRLSDSTGAFIDKPVSIDVSPLLLSGFTFGGYGVGDQVSMPFPAFGGTSPYTYSISSGSVPAGLAINGATGFISGTATTAGQFNWTIRVVDSAGKSLNFGQGMYISPMRLLGQRELPEGRAGQFFSQAISITGGSPPYSFELAANNTLPAGLSLSPTGVISGTPPNVNYGWGFSAIVTDSANAKLNLRLALDILPQTPNPLSINTSVIGEAGTGEHYAYGIYASGGLPPYSFDLGPGSSLPAGMRLFPNGQQFGPGWDPQAGTIAGVASSPGTYSFVVRATDSAGNIATRPYTLKVSPLYAYNQYLPNNGPEPTLGTPFSQYFAIAGGTPPYIVTPINFPAGLSVDNTGRILGTPLENGRFLPLTALVRDSVGNDFTTRGNITVSSTSADPLLCSGGDFSVATAGTQYAANLTCSGSPLAIPNYTATVVAGALPPGMSILTGLNFNNNNNLSAAAQLAGVLTTPGTYTFVVRYTDASGLVGQRAIQLKIGSLAFVTSGLLPGLVGTPYSQSLEVRGGRPPYVFSVDNGSLPSGLTLNATTGVLSGTPTSSSTFGITFRVTDANGEYYLRSLGLTIYNAQITNPSVMPTAIIGQPYNYTFTVSAPGAWTWTSNLNAPPFGLSFNSSTGVVSGVPTGTGVSQFSLTASNGITSVTKNFTFYAVSLPQAGNITGLPTQYLGDFLPGAPLTVTLNIAGGTPPYNVTAPNPAQLPPGLGIVPAETYNQSSNYGRFALAGVPTTTGFYTFKLRYTDSAGTTVDRNVSANITNLAVKQTNVGIGIVNQPYSAQLMGTGGNGTYTYAVTDLINNVMPPGLTLSSSGQISGVPTSTGAFTTTITMASGGLSRRIAVGIGVNATLGRRIDLVFGPALSDLTVGRNAIFTLTPSGGAGTHTWSIVSGSLPPGLNLLADATLPAGTSAPNALVAGAPSAAGTYTFGVRVDDSTGNFAIRIATVTVSPIRPGPANWIYGQSLQIPPGRVGDPYSLNLTAVNGRPPFTYTPFLGNYLPAGLTLNSNGQLSGTPTEAGNFVVNAIITDANGATRKMNLGFQIFPSGKPISLNGTGGFTALQSATAGSPYAFTLNDLILPGTGTGTINWTILSGSLPPGLVITPPSGVASAAITGTPTVTGSYTFALTATDAAGNKLNVLQLNIGVVPLGVSPNTPTLPPATMGTSYSTSLVPAGGTPPYFFRTAFDSDMPAGLSLSQTGILGGIPTSSGTFSLYIEAHDSASRVFRKRYLLTVAPQGAIIGALVLTPASISSTYVVNSALLAPLPISVASSAAPLSYTAVASGGAWLGVAPATGNTPGVVNLTFDTAGLTPNTYTGAVTISSAGASNSPATIPVVLQVLAAAPCQYSLSSSAESRSSASGSGSFGISTADTCNWTAVSDSTWLTIDSPGSGTGIGLVNFRVEPNTGPTQRTAAVTVGGLAYSVTQFGSNCSFTLTSAGPSISAAPAAGVVGLNASASGCPWTAISNSPWLTLSPPTAGSGSGSVSFSVGANTNPASRTGTLTAGGQTFTVQQAGAGCTYSLSKSSDTIASTGGPLTVNLATGPACSWSIDSGPSWIKLQNQSTGAGNTIIAVDIAANSTVAGRSASILVGGQSYSITQAGVPCSFTLNANNPFQPAAGGTGSIGISSAGVGCSWVADSNAEWLSVTPFSGTGNGNLGFTVAGNGSNSARSATLTIAGQNLIVNQSGLVCSYTLRSSSGTSTSAGGPSAIGVIAAAGCPWTASTAAPWITLSNGTSFSGAADLQFSVQANTTASQRTGLLTVAGQIYSFTQQAAPCVVSLDTPSSLSGEFGGPLTVTYSTSVAGCQPPVSSYSSWLTIASHDYTGNRGTIHLLAAPNSFGAVRSGDIHVGDLVHTINQSASTCAYTLTSFANLNVGRLGADGSVPMTYIPAACGSPAVIVNAPPGMISLGPVTNGPGTYTQNYTVSPYGSFLNYTRVAQLKIQGQIYTVKQRSN